MKTTEELYARLLQITARRTLRAGQWLMVFSADEMKQFDDTLLHITSRIYESERLEKEVAELRAELNGALATMMAAAVEIQEHWDAHCDVDGYGPANLMRRLEKGFCNAGYGYSANTVVELTNEISKLRAKLDDVEKFLSLIADRNNWGYFDPSGCPKGIGKYVESWVADGEHPTDMSRRLLQALKEKP